MNEFLASPVLVDSQAFALRLALAGACVCALLLFAARILRRRSEPLQYGILFGGVVGLLTVPVLVGLGQCLSVPTAPPEDEVLKVPVEMLTDFLNRPAPAAPIPRGDAISLAGQLAMSALGMFWALGFAFGLARFVRAIVKQHHMFLRQPWHAPFWTGELQMRLALQLGLKRFPTVDVSPAVPMPMVIGIWRPIIVLPASSPTAWGQAQWEAVLLHEAAHIARGDHWAALAQRIAVLLFWWCPLVYPLNRRLNELRENICDDYALQGPCDPIAYAELLVESAERLVHLTTAPVSLALLDSAHGGLEARITRLLAKEKRTMTKLSRTGKLLGVGCLIAAGMLTMAATAFSGGQPTPEKKVQIKIIIDGKEIDITDAKLLDLLQAPKKDAGQPKKTRLQLNEAYFEVAPKKAAGKDAPKAGDSIYFSLPIEFAPTQAAPARADPRIEALVKQAEAIKPGSGAAIRDALKGAPKVRSVAVWQLAPEPKKEPAPAKKVIILQLEAKQAKTAQEPEAKKPVEKGLRFKLQLDNPLPGLVPATPKTAPAADLDALRRQLDRITADLHELRKRLDASNKK